MAEEKKVEAEPGVANAPDAPDLRGVSLPDVVHLECVGRNSSVVELFQEHSLGRIYIDQGQIVHATCGEISGERAFQKLFTITAGTFELLEYEVPPERTINRTWEFLLNEVLRQREQFARRAAAGEDLSANGENTPPAQAAWTAEILICSGAGEIFYHWQCAAPAERMALLQKISAGAEKLIPNLQLGKLDRVEVRLAEGRVVLQPRADRLVFVRLSAAKK